MGLKWIPEHDLLTLRGGKERGKGNLHKRDVLSDIQSFVDPIGYTSPFVLKEKLLFQELNQTVPTLSWRKSVYYHCAEMEMLHGDHQRST